MAERTVKIYPLFERFWHWSQTVLVLVLMATGFRVAGFYEFGLRYETAFSVHIIAALTIMVLWVFAIFWHLTTGTWRHYLPTREGFPQVARFYTIGIFKGEPHPYRKAYLRKHNPLQAMAYLSLKAVLLPGIWVTGLLYLTYGVWGSDPARTGWLPVVADLHVFFALALVTFVVAHLYMLTAGHSFKEHVKPMISGFDKVDLTPEQEAYLSTTEPGRLREDRST